MTDHELIEVKRSRKQEVQFCPQYLGHGAQEVYNKITEKILQNQFVLGGVGNDFQPPVFSTNFVKNLVIVILCRLILFVVEPVMNPLMTLRIPLEFIQWAIKYFVNKNSDWQ